MTPKCICGILNGILEQKKGIREKLRSSEWSIDIIISIGSLNMTNTQSQCKILIVGEVVGRVYGIVHSALFCNNSVNLKLT